jgi:hypothetical protein
MIYLILVGHIFWVLLLQSIELCHLTNHSHARSPWATEMWWIVGYFFNHITIKFYDDDE